ncbi:MAG: hypothetical protein ABI321_05730 [Polyangia bacterium]
MTRFTALAFLALTSLATSFAVGCGGSSSKGTDDMTTSSTDGAIASDGAVDSPDAASGPLCKGKPGNCVAVATSIFNSDFTGSGNLNTVDTTTGAASLNLDTSLDADTTFKYQNGQLYVLQRDSGSVRIYDPSTFVVKSETPVGDSAHPSASTYSQGLYIAADGKLWITLAGNPAASSLGIVDTTAPGVITYVALPQATADTDGKPEPFKLYPCNGKLYVLMQSYYFGSDSVIHYTPGRIVSVDLTTKAVGTPIVLTGTNPSDITQVGATCSDVVVSTASGLTTSPDGTGDLERVDLAAGTSTVLATDMQLGGRPTLLASTGSTLYVAEYFDPQPNGTGAVYLSSVKIIAFDVATKTVGIDVTGKFGNINFMQIDGASLYFGAGIYSNMEATGKLPRGLYITPANGAALTASPIDLELTPSAIAFTQ